MIPPPPPPRQPKTEAKRLIERGRIDSEHLHRIDRYGPLVRFQIYRTNAQGEHRIVKWHGSISHSEARLATRNIWRWLP